jgi:hypothetical protein
MNRNKAEPWQSVYTSVVDVLAISRGLVLICELPGGRRFGVPLDQISSRSEVREPGHRGTLTVLRWFAEYHELPVE